MKILSKLFLISAVFFSSAVMSKPLIIRCELKVAGSPGSKVVKVNAGKSGSSNFVMGRYKGKVKGIVKGHGYGTTLAVKFEVEDKRLVSKVIQFSGVRVKMNEISYGALETIIIYNGFNKKNLFAQCSLN